MMLNFKEKYMLPNPVITIFGKGIYMYGICIAVGLIACLIAFYMLSKRKGMPTVLQDFVFLILIVGLATGFLAAQFFQAFYNWLDGKPFSLFGAGFTVMGGLIGGAAGFLIFYFLVGKFYFKGKRKDIHKKHFNTLIRVAPICIVIAHGFGRIGCLMSGCCHGAYLGQDYVFGGIWMNGTVDGMHKWGYYVPTQLYEALFLFALAVFMIILLFKRCNVIMSVYLVCYGFWRIIIEFFRADQRGAMVLGLAPSQWQSMLFIAGGIALYVIYVIKKWPIFFKEGKELELKEQTDNAVLEKETDEK